MNGGKENKVTGGMESRVFGGKGNRATGEKGDRATGGKEHGVPVLLHILQHCPLIRGRGTDLGEGSRDIGGKGKRGAWRKGK